MNRHKIWTLMVFILLIAAFRGYGQQVKVERSDEKVIIGDQKYYVHQVKKGQTLYSISQAYGVSQKVIARENPDILLGLRPGQALKIPYRPERTKDEPSRDTSRYRSHRVRKGQTLYSLAQQYHVSPEVLRRHNPVLYDQELQAGQTLKLPRDTATRKASGRDERQRAKTSRFIYHRVQKGETLYALSQRYQVDIRQIIGANEKLKKEDLQVGSVVRIPRKKASTRHSPVMASSRPDQLRDTVPTYYHTVRKHLPRCDSSGYYQRRTLRVGLFLPFYLEKNQQQFYVDSTRFDARGEAITQKVKRNPNDIYPASEHFVEFYEGVLMALDSLAGQDIRVDLQVFDTAGDSSRTREILNQPDLSSLDLMVGPVYKSNFRVMARFARRHQIHIISPFSKSPRWLQQNPYVLQIYPSRDAQLDQFAAYISHFSDKNMILVHSGDSLFYPQIRKFKDKIFSYLTHDTTFADVRFKEVAFKDSLYYLKQAMNRGEENIMIVPSEEEAFVTDVVNNLNTLSKQGYDMRVFGYSNWQDFVNIELEYFYNINLTLFTPFHVDYRRPPVRRVIRKYRQTFYSEPSRYVFHGFDISYYFLTALHRYGRHFEDCLYQYDLPLCHSDYRFYRPYQASGMENVGLYLLKYRDDLTIDRVTMNRYMPQWVNR